MQITAKQIRELASKKRDEAALLPYGSIERLRAMMVASNGERYADELDALQELLGVSYLSVEINDCP